MCTLKFASIFVLCAAACAMPALAGAQQSSARGQDAPPPPRLEKLEEDAPPSVTIKEQKNRQTITEKRAPGGKVTEVKVTKGNNTYYGKPNLAPGSALPGDGQSPQTRPAQWEVFEFNAAKKRKPANAGTDAPAPPVLLPAAPAGK